MLKGALGNSKYLKYQRKKVTHWQRTKIYRAQRDLSLHKSWCFHSRIILLGRKDKHAVIV